jgi:acetoin utilization protein AcuA
MIIACCNIETPATLTKEFFLEGPVITRSLENLNISNKLTNFRQAEEQKKALISISKLPKGMIYIARSGREIIGYITFHRPEEYFRWSKHPTVLELGGIEISSDWRKKGIAEALLNEAFSNLVMEDFIVITMEFCWSWDLKGSGMEIFEYQKMLEKLFGLVSLKRRATNDPEITEHPANVLMARVGENVRSKDIILFEKMLLEETPQFH